MSDPMTSGDHVCPICERAFSLADNCSTDIELGVCHAECLAGSPVVDLETGEPVEGEADVFPYSEVSDDKR